MRYFSTGQAAELLGILAHRLEYLTRDRQLRPAKGPTGAFNWTYEDVVRAAHLLGIPAPPQAAFPVDHGVVCTRGTSK